MAPHRFLTDQVSRLTSIARSALWIYKYLHIPTALLTFGSLEDATPGGRSQDGGGIGRVITFSSTNSLKEQQNGEQSLQNNF